MHIEGAFRFGGCGCDWELGGRAGCFFYHAVGNEVLVIKFILMELESLTNPIQLEDPGMTPDGPDQE